MWLPGVGLDRAHFGVACAMSVCPGQCRVDVRHMPITRGAPRIRGTSGHTAPATSTIVAVNRTQARNAYLVAILRYAPARRPFSTATMKLYLIPAHFSHDFRRSDSGNAHLNATTYTEVPPPASAFTSRHTISILPRHCDPEHRPSAGLRGPFSSNARSECEPDGVSPTGTVFQSKGHPIRWLGHEASTSDRDSS
ncbi:hypothetical protein BD311DRAFT_260729 [Dichomitus squalens]|uniref:Uncharacterized protein n=1 Tax=Dichomitus squalens TaxID=114155 RepID=A0A4Q9MPM1_9APHY|nr:hypothetical protein BD311DRAFT_260729 [Dichomitus squalens]